MINVLFVCMGNICRSPTAQGIFEAMVLEAGLSDKIHCESAGTHGYHTGELPHSTTRKAAKARNYDLVSRVQLFTKKHFSSFDYIVAMGEDNHQFILQMAASDSDKKKITPFISYCKSFQGKFNEVPDPYYGGPQGFETVLDICEEGCRTLLNQIMASSKISR